MRVIFLGSVPYGFHADEARAAWGAWTIANTGKDDWGNKLPLYYDIFGDQRPTGVFYLTIPFLLILGRSVFAARLGVALVGALSIYGVYWFCLLITKNEKISLLSSVVLALSPWHIVMSRSGSEGVVASALIIFGLALWVKGLVKNQNKLLIYSIILGIVGYFFYHSSRILVPVYWLTTWFLISKKKAKSALYAGILLLASLLILSQAQARGRFSQVSIFSQTSIKDDLVKASIEEGPNRVFITRVFHNKLVWYAKEYVNNYLDYFSGRFLVGNASLPMRYSIPNTGPLTYVDLLLFLIGVGFLFYIKRYYIIGILLILSPLVSAVTATDIPNIHRSLNMVLFISILEGIGLYYLLVVQKRKWIGKIFMAGFVILWIFFWHNYSVHTPKSVIAYHRDGGSMELAQKINEIKSDYPIIYLTDTPSDLTPWIGYFGNYNISEFIAQSSQRRERNWSIENLYFARTRCVSEIVKDPEENSLLVDAEGCKDPEGDNYKLEFAIKRPDESSVYKAWKFVK